MNVLFIEDDRMNRRVVGDMLEVAGAAMTGAENAEEGLAILDREDFDILLVDLREATERAKHGTLAGALHTPYPTIGDSLKAGGMLREVAAASHRRIVFFCAFGERSAMAVKAAKDAGIADAMHLEGGIDAWKKAGGPVIAG